MVNLGLVYRPPNQSREVDTRLNSFIKEVASKPNCIILGDFNYPEINWKYGVGPEENNDFLETIADNYLTQLVVEPTRGNNILDLVFTSDENIVDNLEVGEHLSDSDHNIIRFEIVTSIGRKENSTLIPNFTHANFEEIRSKLREVNWQSLLSNTDTNNQWGLFKTHLLELIYKDIPMKKIRSAKKTHA